MIIKDEKTRRIIFLLSWLLLATGLALVEWSNSRIVAIILFTILTATAVFNFFSMTKVQEKNNESDPKANDSVDSNMMASESNTKDNLCAVLVSICDSHCCHYMALFKNYSSIGIYCYHSCEHLQLF